MDKDNYMEWYENMYSELIERYLDRHPLIREKFEEWCIRQYSEQEYDHYEDLKERERIINEEKNLFKG